jgi:hypothetical protein
MYGVSVNHFVNAFDANVIVEPGDLLPLEAPTDWYPDVTVNGQPAVILRSHGSFARVRYVLRCWGRWIPTGQGSYCAKSELKDWRE